MSLPRLGPPAELAHHGGYRPIRLLCLRRLGYMETARARWREEQERQAANRRPPARRQRVTHRRQPPQRPPRPPAAARQLPADAPVPREPTLVRPDLAHQLPVFQAALPSSRGETSLRQRGGMLCCRRVTARCGCARARSMRWRCWPQGVAAWSPSSASRAGGGTGYSTCARWCWRSTRTPRGSSSHQLAPQAALEGNRVSVLESVAYGDRKMSAPHGRRECWRSEPGLQRSP